MEMPSAQMRLNRTHLLAAEVYGYSFQNYEDHLGIGNQRYDKIMPERAMLLEQAVSENWPIATVAARLEISAEDAENLLDVFRKASAVIDAESPAESFRNAVRFLVQDAASEGLSSGDAIEKLVTQICYRAADLSYLLDLRDERLSRYSKHLRREPGIEYYEGYFDEDDA
jgi:hypothetical protein